MEALLDPQGKAVTLAMSTIGLSEIQGVRIGRHIRLFVEADSMENATQKVDQACKQMLANQIMESYEFSIEVA
jgi:phosphoribosylformylglycinamidine synthase